MSKYKIPQDNRKFSQVNDGDVSGNLWLTQNIDLKSNKGKIRLSPRLIINKSSDDDNDLGRVSAFARYYIAVSGSTYGYWCQAGTVLFKTTNTDDPTQVFAQDAIASSPTDLNYLFSGLC